MSAPARLVPIDAVVDLLNGRAGELARELLPHGRREGSEWRCGSLAGEPGTSLGVHIGGGKAGVWSDFGTGEAGDALDLVAQVLFRGDKREALAWARRWLGLESGDPAQLAIIRRQAAEQREKRDIEGEQEAEQKRAAAQRMWLDGQRLAGTPAAGYLAARGIVLARLPNALRFHPRLWNVERGDYLPGMVAAIQDTEGRYVATHRTFLEQIGGVWRKARVRDPKLTLGGYAGGWIRLTRGASGRSWPEMQGEETVVFAEGIENALSMAVLVPEWRAAAAVSLGNLTRISLPKAVRDVVIAADNDAPNSKAVVALKKALDHLLALGLRVRVARPDGAFKDWNDELRNVAERSGGESDSGPPSDRESAVAGFAS